METSYLDPYTKKNTVLEWEILKLYKKHLVKRRKKNSDFATW